MSKTPDDQVVATSNGKLKLVVAGVEHVLRRPTIGQQRDLTTELQAVADLQSEQADLPDDERDPDAVQAGMLNWWRSVVRELDTTGGGTLPGNDDDLPPFLLNSQLAFEVRQHWMTVPWGPGGSPSQQAAKQAELVNRQAERLLSALTPAAQPS
jgi:hypothetical protein